MTLSPVTRRLGAAAVATAAALALLVGCASPSPTGATSSPGLTTLTVGLPGAAAAGGDIAETGPFGYAEAKGLAAPILEKHGFVFDRFVGFTNGPPVIQAIQTGDVNLGVVGDTPAVQARGNGQDISFVVVNKPNFPLWFVSNDPSITSIADLAGKRVGVKFGSNLDKYARQALDRYGALDLKNLVDLPDSGTLPALQRGDVTAVVGSAANASTWVADNPELVVTSKGEVDDPDLVGAGGWVAQDDFIAQHPEIGKAIWEVYQAGVAEIQNDQDAYLRWIVEVTAQDLEAVKAGTVLDFSEAQFDPTGLESVKNTFAYLSSTNVIADKFDVGEWLTP